MTAMTMWLRTPVVHCFAGLALAAILILAG
jgi:hypothetical protein